MEILLNLTQLTGTIFFLHLNNGQWFKLENDISFSLTCEELSSKVSRVFVQNSRNSRLFSCWNIAYLLQLYTSFWLLFSNRFLIKLYCYLHYTNETSIMKTSKISEFTWYKNNYSASKIASIIFIWVRPVSLFYRCTPTFCVTSLWSVTLGEASISARTQLTKKHE